MLSFLISLIEFQERLRKLRYNLNEISNSSSITSTTTTTTSSPSLFTSTNNSTSNVNEDIKDIVNVNGKGNSLRKFTRHPHHHRSYHQSQQHSHSTTTISSTMTSTTQMFSTPKISSPLPTCDNFDQKIDEDNKENRIPRLIIRNTSSIGHCSTPYLNNVIINSTCNSTPISSYVTYSSSSSSSSTSSSTSASFSSSSVTSTPVNNLHSRVNGLMMQWQSTPLQYNNKYNSLLSDSDSGFFSSGIQSMGFTPNANNVVR
ncbi:unnamed protein product, partial [Schistosoma mattheei]